MKFVIVGVVAVGGLISNFAYAAGASQATTNLVWQKVSGNADQVPLQQPGNTVVVSEQHIRTANPVSLPFKLSLIMTPQRHENPVSMFRIIILPADAPKIDFGWSNAPLVVTLRNDLAWGLSADLIGVVRAHMEKKRPIKVGKDARVSLNVRQGRVRFMYNGDPLAANTELKLPEPCRIEMYTDSEKARWQVNATLEKADP